MIHCAVCSCRDRFLVRRATGIHFRRTRQLFFGQFQIAGTDYIPWYAGIRFAGVLGAPENGFSSWRYPRFQVIESDVAEGKLRQQAGLRGIRFLFSPGRIGFAPMWARGSRNRTVSLVAYAGKHFSAANLLSPAGAAGRKRPWFHFPDRPGAVFTNPAIPPWRQCAATSDPTPAGLPSE